MVFFQNIPGNKDQHLCISSSILYYNMTYEVKFNEECGVFWDLGHPDAAKPHPFWPTTSKHRGQEVRELWLMTKGP